MDRTGAQRVVIDSLALVERIVAEASGAARLPSYLLALVEALRRRRVSALLVKEHGTLSTNVLDLSSDTISMAAATVLWLQQVTYRDRLYRVLSVPKMRFSAHDVTLREFTIEAPTGLVLRDAYEGETEALTRILKQAAPEY